jgi:hypothetical protein
MPDYRRAWHPGGTYFFTVNLLQRQAGLPKAFTPRIGRAEARMNWGMTISLLWGWW